MELAKTTLTAPAYLSGEVGDAVVFEGVSPPADDGPWPCAICIGGWKAPAELLHDGDLRPGGRFVHEGDSSVQDMSEKDRLEGGLTADGAALLASAPVEVVAEIGRVPMRGDEVLGLLSGVVLSLGERRRDLRHPARRRARLGPRRLVTIDDSLGVRITEVLRQR